MQCKGSPFWRVIPWPVILGNLNWRCTEGNVERRYTERRQKAEALKQKGIRVSVLWPYQWKKRRELLSQNAGRAVRKGAADPWLQVHLTDHRDFRCAMKEILRRLPALHWEYSWDILSRVSLHKSLSCKLTCAFSVDFSLEKPDGHHNIVFLIYQTELTTLRIFQTHVKPGWDTRFVSISRPRIANAWCVLFQFPHLRPWQRSMIDHDFYATNEPESISEISSDSSLGSLPIPVVDARVDIYLPFHFSKYFEWDHLWSPAPWLAAGVSG